MQIAFDSRPWIRGGVVGVGLGRKVWVGGGVCLALAASGGALGAPEGEQVVHGQAQFVRNGLHTRITAADKTVINYNSFNINQNEIVQFVQPHSQAKVLNRITGADPTQIAGTIQANGIVYIVNPAGVFFAKGALVDVGGIYAAAGNISNRDFLNGNNTFTGVRGSVVNEGAMRVAEGGIAALVGQNVVNGGSITAEKGAVAMVAGNEVVLGDRGGVMSVRVTPQEAGANPPAPGSIGVHNTGRINARQGATRIVAGDMYSLAIKNTGTIRSGEVRIDAQGGGDVSLSGKIDARNGRAGGLGGVIQVTGDKIAVVNASLDASGRRGGGEINIGGGYQGGGDLAHADLTVVQNSSMRADALKRGHGGEVVVWSDSHTSFNGAASAKGGALGGDGGVVETSSKGSLDVRGGHVVASAENGKAGTWLLDPNNVVIDQVGGTIGGTFDGSDPNTFTPIVAATVDVDDVNASLNSGTDVTILTGSTGADPGNITLAAGAVIDKTMGDEATLTLRAANDVNIDGTIQSSSDALNVNLFANSSGSGNNDLNPAQGDVNLGAASVINTNGGDLAIQGQDFNGAAGFSVDAGAGSVAFRPDIARSAGVNTSAADFDVSAAELQSIAASGVSIETTAAGVTIGGDGAVDLSGEAYDVTLDGTTVGFTNGITLADNQVLTINSIGAVTGGAGTDVTIGGGNGALAVTSADAVTLDTQVGVLAVDAGGAITINETDALVIDDVGMVSGLDSGGNSIVVNTGDSLAITADVNGGAGSVTLNAMGGDAGDLSVNAGVSGGTVTLNADNSVAFGTSAVVSASAGAVNVNADVDSGGVGGGIIIADGASITASTGANFTATNDISDLGDTDTDPAITASEITMASTAGAIGAGDEIDTAATTLTLTAPMGVNVANTGAATATVNSSDGAVTFSNSGTLATGGAWTGDTVAITSSDTVTLDHDVTADNGGVSIGTQTLLTVQTGRTVSAMGGDIAIEASDIDLAGSLSAGMGDVALSRATGGTIGVGLATGDMQVSNGELGNITADELTLGGAATTEIRVNGVTSAATMNIRQVNLDATGDDATIAFIGTESMFRALNAEADDGITVDANITISEGDLALDGDADMAMDNLDEVNIGSGITLSTEPMGGNIILSAATGGVTSEGGLIVNSAQDITLGSELSSTGSITFNAGGAITLEAVSAGSVLMLNADDGLTLNADVNNTGSAVLINADANEDGNGLLLLAAGRTINTGNSDLTITAADITLDGSILSGTGIVSIRRATAGTIGLGTATGDLALSAGELSRITAGTLRLGNGDTTGFNVAGVDSTALANISSLVEVITDQMDISGEFHTAMADLSITRATNGEISLGTGMDGLVISGAELANITTPELTLGGGQTTSITVGGVSEAQSMGIGALRLDAAEMLTFSGGASTFRALTGLARDGVRVNSNVTTTDGNLFLDGNSDNDTDVMDNIAIADGRVLTSGGNLQLDATSGGIDGAGSVSLSADGDILINDSLSSNGVLDILADTDMSGQGVVNIAAGATILSSGNPVTIQGTNLILAGNINAGTGMVAIRRSNQGAITLGVGSQGMVISGAELARIISTGLTIGGATTGQLIVNSITNANSNTIVGVTRLEALADGGQIVFNGSTSTFNALEAVADNGITLNAAVATDTGGIVMNGNFDNAADGVDAVRLRRNVQAPNSQDVRFDSDVLVGGETTTVSANDILFNGRVDSETGRRNFTVNSNGTGLTVFGADVGSQRALRSLTTNADGTTRLSADIDAAGGDITFHDIIRVDGDIRVRALDGGNVFFHNTVDSHGVTQRDLTVVVDTDTANDAATIPIISFGRDVGVTFELGDLNLNFDPTSGVNGHENGTRLATIIARPRNSQGQLVNQAGDFTFNTAGTFRMGEGERMTVTGDLTINTATAIIGDIATLGDLCINAGSIGIQTREAGLIAGAGSAVAPDMGVDIVSGGEIKLSVTPSALGGGPAPTFATQTGAGDANGNLQGFIFRAFGPITLTDFSAVSSGVVTTLDLRAQGPTNTNPASAIAGAVPRETRQNDVGQQTTLGQAELEDLKNLGIVPRNATTQELLDFLIGSTIYNDVPRRTAPAATDYTTVVNRLPADRVTALLRSYDRIFNTELLDDEGRPEIDEATGEAKRVSKADEIRATLLASVRRYREIHTDDEGDIDPVRFRSYVDTTPEEAESAQYLAQLARFLDQLEEVGLTPRELSTSKNILLKDVRPAGMGSIANFEAVIRAGRGAAAGEPITMR